MDTAHPRYAERLGVPLRWWVQATMMVASFWLALVVALPGLAAWGITALVMAVVAAAYLTYGSAVVEVADGHLRAGRARIELDHVGRVEALDREQARLAAGPQADARAFLLLRPYVHRAVRVEITDPADPAPYWLVSTRHPEDLARALSGQRREPA
ncbi:DUF3093 domain-containing protein [Nocardioides lentus]|uniref:DUF3093 domain-containing protein n=1 Tax=Nocardioides lentus TaxID=338077 RepID=A0ABP5AD56_9ACTN